MLGQARYLSIYTNIVIQFIIQFSLQSSQHVNSVWMEIAEGVACCRISLDGQRRQTAIVYEDERRILVYVGTVQQELRLFGWSHKVYTAAGLALLPEGRLPRQW